MQRTKNKEYRNRKRTTNDKIATPNGRKTKCKNTTSLEESTTAKKKKLKREVVMQEASFELYVHPDIVCLVHLVRTSHDQGVTCHIAKPWFLPH
jgi:hypothetical protein